MSRQAEVPQAIREVAERMLEAVPKGDAIVAARAPRGDMGRDRGGTAMGQSRSEALGGRKMQRRKRTALEKARQYSRDQLEQILDDEDRLKALPPAGAWPTLSARERELAADEWVLQLHACATVCGRPMTREDYAQLTKQAG